MRARLKVVARTGDGGAVYLSSTADSSALLFAKPGQEVQREHFDGPVRSVKGNACVDFEAITRTRSSLITITDRGLLLHTYGFCSSCMEGSHDWELWPVCPNPLSAFNSLPGAERDEDRHDVVRTSEPVPEPEPVFTPVPAPEPEPEPVPSEPVEAAEGKKSRVRWLASRRAAAEVDASASHSSVRSLPRSLHRNQSLLMMRWPHRFCVRCGRSMAGTL